jgi:tetratricopeptide (TPR) repeat protein
MKKVVFLIFPFLAISYSTTLFAQSAVNGVVILHNSFFNNKTKVDYVQNAQVDGLMVKTKPTITDANGVFKLTAINAKPNEKIRIKIVKDGYQVVNPSSLFALTDQADTVRIFMAKPEDIEASRSAYFAAMKALSEQTFKKKIGAINADLKSAYSQSSVDATTVATLEKALKSTNDGGRKLETIAQKMATLYSLTNWDDAAPHCQTAFEFVQRGAIDSALVTFDEAQLSERAEFLLGQKSRNTVTDVAVWEAKFKRNINALMVQADFYQLKWEVAQADSVYQLMLKFDPKNGMVYRKYADFLLDINDLNRAKAVCEKGLSLVQLSEDKIELMDRLGELHATFGDFRNAEKVLSQASDMADWEIINNKAVFEPLYALTQLHLGQAFTKMKNYNGADAAFSAALKFHQEYATKSPARPKDSLLLGATFKAMAINFQRQNDFAQTLVYFDKTWAIYTKVLDMNSAYKTDIADLKNNYAQLYLAQKDTTQALKYLSQEFEIYATAVRSKHTAFEADYLAALVNLSTLYLNSKDYDRAMPILQDIAATQKSLVAAHPTHYELDLEKTLKSLGTIYWAQKKYVLVDTTFKQMANLHPTVLKGTPQYRSEICAFHSRFGAFYKEQNKTELAENQYVKSVDLRKELVDKDALQNGENQQSALQNIISLHDTLLIGQIFENKINAHKKIQTDCRTEMVNVQNKIIAALEKTTTKDKQAKLTEAYGNLAAYYVSLNKIKDAELVAQKQENSAAHFLIFVYGIQDKFTEAQAVFAKVGDKKTAKKLCLQWANEYYEQKVISWDTKTKINKWLEASATIGLLGN